MPHHRVYWNLPKVTSDDQSRIAAGIRLDQVRPVCTCDRPVTGGFKHRSFKKLGLLNLYKSPC